jgi:AraC-like DNA-binding protein
VREAPSDDLADHLAHYWWVSWDLRGLPSFVTETLPHPTVHLVFEARRGRVVGVPSGAFRRRLTGQRHVFGVKFRPAAFSPWLGAPLSTITDQRMPLRALWADAPALVAEVSSATAVAAAIAAVVPALRRRAPPLDATTLELRDLVERMSTDASITRAEQAAALAGVTLRTLQRAFERRVGVSPKWVIRRYRLHEAAARLTQPEPPSLADLAAELGYFDQAHFAREFKAVVGAPPSRYTTPPPARGRASDILGRR